MTKIRFHALAATVLCAAAFAACGDSNDDGGGNGACTVALTGAVTGSVTCTTAVGAYTTITNQSAVSLLTTGTAPGMALSVAFTGTLHTGAFQSNAVGALGGITVTNGNSTWFATPTAGSTSGSFTVNLTTVTAISTTAQGTAYTIHGSIDATLPALAGSGTTGTVTVHATF